MLINLNDKRIPESIRERAWEAATSASLLDDRAHEIIALIEGSLVKVHVQAPWAIPASAKMLEDGFKRDVCAGAECWTWTGS